jgi:hypothetical protein
MRQSKNNNTNNGIGFAGILTLIFITLKLTGYINWSWIWVLSPTWIPMIFVLLIIILFYMLNI